MDTSVPVNGMVVMFGSLLMRGPYRQRTGVIVDADPINFVGSRVAADFLPDDGPENNPPGKVIHGCLYFPEDPNGTELPASHWQYCFPIVDADGYVLMREAP